MARASKKILVSGYRNNTKEKALKEILLNKNVLRVEKSNGYVQDASIFLSLIIATLGRTTEVALMLESVSKSDFDLSKIEVLIVDQNKEDILADCIKKFDKTLQIVHIKTSELGLSRNRNIGIAYSRGKYFGVPDDDCEYFPTTIKNVEMVINNRNQPAAIMGRITDRGGILNDNMRTWPSEFKEVSRISYYRLTSSNTLFCINNGIQFDDNFGVGARYGANEDADLILRLLKQRKKIVYDPLITVYHPDRIDQTKETQMYKKAYTYGIGFGALCRKHLDAYSLILFISALIFHLLKGMLSLTKGDLVILRMRLHAFWGRIIGFLTYGH